MSSKEVVQKIFERSMTDAKDVIDSLLYEKLSESLLSLNEKKLDPVGKEDGDIDNDGLYEIVTMVTETDFITCHPAAYEVSSTGVLQLERVSEETLWCNDTLGYSNHSSHAPAFGDLDNDGNVEVLYGDSVYEGSDLSLRFSGGSGAAWLNSWFEFGAQFLMFTH